ncbi:chloramphenicol acetyltransferase [Myroides odoratimimus]|uniref:chloramphenicol acetyltransferase n=1 Tax=Myroides odoratimimus TaxID=76832 RepID=UPI00257530CA|nr:chloramphenicol acetyltransferase [Myroides odoratimimus]MDM1326650.1 chloramphenicol acetyltransferase CAT [Myroides odoratimimus]
MTKEAKFTPIDLESWNRTPYYEYYRNILKTKYTVSIKIDITEVFSLYKSKEYKFFPTFLYIIMKALNNSEELRTCIHEGQLGTWNFLAPQYTLFHEDDKTFSDLWSEHADDFKAFHHNIISDIEKYKDVKGIKIKEGLPANFVPISCVPWISFESISQDTSHDSDFLKPIIRFGKYYQEHDKVLIPLSIYVNHAIADGYHTSMFLQDIQDIANDARNWIL